MLDKEILENAVRIKQGLATMDIADLNKYIGQVVLNLAESHGTLGRLNIENAVKSVAKEQFEKDHGKSVVSWVDYAEEYGEDTPAKNAYCFQALDQLRLERM